MSSPRIDKTALCALLSSSVGEAMALQAVNQASQRLGLKGDDFDQPQALQLLELLAASPGLMGITARFTKSRLILNWPK